MPDYDPHCLTCQALVAAIAQAELSCNRDAINLHMKLLETHWDKAHVKTVIIWKAFKWIVAPEGK